MNAYDKHGIPHGPWQNFYNDGTLREKGHYDHGHRYGFWEWYYKTGELFAIGHYFKGNYGLWKYYDNDIKEPAFEIYYVK